MRSWAQAMSVNRRQNTTARFTSVKRNLPHRPFLRSISPSVSASTSASGIITHNTMMRTVAEGRHVSRSERHDVHRRRVFAAYIRDYQPSAALAALAALLVSLIFLRKSFSKFSASILGGPPSIILRILAVRPMLRRQDKLRTRDSMT